MAVANTSYLTDVDELGLYVDVRLIRRLVTREDETDPEEELAGARLDRITQAMNTAARRVENLWRNHYDLTDAGKITDSVSATSPNEVVKEWNARWTLNIVETMAPSAPITQDRKELIEEIATALAAGSDQVFAETRNDQVMPAATGTNIRGTVFDDGGYWNNVIPSDEQDGFVT